MKKILTKTYIYPFLTLVLLGIIGFQAYFDIQLRKINKAVVSDILVIGTFIAEQFPEQVNSFNESKQQK